jgi:hypothetical protein
VTFLDGPASVGVWNFTHRGIPSATAVLCFVREVKVADGSPVRLVYALVVEVPPEQIDSLLPVLAGIAETVRLGDVRRPIDIPLDATGALMRDAAKGYSIRIPDGWVAYRSDMGLVMGQLDYAEGGVASPTAEVFAVTLPESWTSQALAERAVGQRTEKGFHVDVLSQGPSRLGGAEGYQFALRKTPESGPATQTVSKLGGASGGGRPWIEVGRAVCIPTSDGQTRVYAIVLNGYDCPPEQAETLMDSLASTFALAATEGN